MKRSTWLLVASLPLVAAQLVQPDPPKPLLVGDAPMTAYVATPSRVQSILERACYDCHSPETRWPWYSRVSPVSWWITQHVEHGRSNLDFSRWSADPDLEPTPAQRLRWTCQEVQAGLMPPRNYRLLHPEARLQQTEKDEICAWTRAALEALEG